MAFFGGSSNTGGNAPGAFSFGNTAPAPSTSAVGGGGGGGIFGGSPNPAPSFGAPASGGGPGLFGGPSTTFGSPAPAPAFGSFGAPSPAAAPASNSFGFGSFGAPAPGGSFGSTPNTGFGPPAAGGPNLFGTPQQQQQQHAPPPTTTPISSKMLYKDLPPELQQGVDRLHDVIMNHRRTMARVRSLGPAALIEQDDGKGGTMIPLQNEIQEIKTEIENNLVPQSNNLLEQVTALHEEIRRVMASTIVHASWPVEFMANIRGIRITKSEEKKEERIDATLHAILDQQATHVSRVERLPSPFYWEALEDMRGRLEQLQGAQEQIKARAHQEDWDDMPVTYLINQQDEKLHYIRVRVTQLQTQMEQIRAHYARIETKVPNVLDEADLKEASRARQEAEGYQRHLYLTTEVKPPGTTPAPAAGTPAAATAPATPSFGGFGSTPAPAPNAFSFSSTPAAAPTSNLFGSSTPAFGGFGANSGSTAPAPALGTTPSFGATPSFSSSSSTPRKNKPGGRRRK